MFIFSEQCYHVLFEDVIACQTMLVTNNCTFLRIFVDYFILGYLISCYIILCLRNMWDQSKTRCFIELFFFYSFWLSGSSMCRSMSNLITTRNRNICLSQQLKVIGSYFKVQEVYITRFIADINLLSYLGDKTRIHNEKYTAILNTVALTNY
jgi:hypothetical protein